VDSVGAWRRAHRAFEKGESDYVLGEGGGGRLFHQASPARQRFSGGEEVVQECVVDCYWV